jgi:tryptophan-rich sensory protein
MVTKAPLFDKRRDLIGLFGFFALTFLTSVIGGMATAESVATWYPTLAKPSFNPPNWIFAPVWATLYAMMALAGWRIWRFRGFAGSQRELTLFGVQLVLNCLWSILFFGLRQIGWALADIVILLVLIVVTAVLFWRRERLAGLLLVPYAIWVAFAAVLNFAIWRMN